MPVISADIIPSGSSGGRTVIDMPGIMTASEMKKLVMVKYAGFLSECIFLGEGSSGSLNSESSDFISSNHLLRDYVILTDEVVSFTGYEEFLVKKKAIHLSIELRKEVNQILLDHKNEVEEIALFLVEKNMITVKEYLEEKSISSI